MGHVRQTGLTDGWVAKVVKRYVESIGLDPDHFAGRSLRAGFIMSAAVGGATERSIMKQTRHRSAYAVRRYIRDADVPLNSNTVRLAGL